MIDLWSVYIIKPWLIFRRVHTYTCVCAGCAQWFCVRSVVPADADCAPLLVFPSNSVESGLNIERVFISALGWWCELYPTIPPLLIHVSLFRGVGWWRRLGSWSRDAHQKPTDHMLFNPALHKSIQTSLLLSCNSYSNIYVC